MIYKENSALAKQVERLQKVYQEGSIFGKNESLKPRKALVSTRICRHHGETEFYWAKDNSTSKGGWKCTICTRAATARTKNKVKIKPLPGCSNYVGLYIAEQVLRKAFDVMIKAHPMEKWDFVCGQGFTVDSKCSTLRKTTGTQKREWQFHIKKNKAPKFFCCIALDNTPENVADDPRPIHVWLIPGDAIIDGRPLNDRISLTVTPRTLERVAKYRRTDMEGKIIKCCNHLKDNEI
jgi:hypothetical protein